MRGLFHILLLASADYRRERLLSLCSILGLTAVLAPLLILYGVKFGVMTTLTDRLLSDPNTMEVSPVSSGRFTARDFEQWRQVPGVAFVLPRTRSIAATMTLMTRVGDEPVTATVSLEPTAVGDPLLERWKAPSVTMVPWQDDKAVEPAATPEAEEAPAVLPHSEIPGSAEPDAVPEAEGVSFGFPHSEVSKSDEPATAPEAEGVSFGFPHPEIPGADEPAASEAEAASTGLPHSGIPGSAETATAPEAEGAAASGPVAPGLKRLPAEKHPHRPALSRVPEITDPQLRQSGVVLTEPAARMLNVRAGDAVLGRVERSSGGVISSAWVRLNVAGVLPLAARQNPTAYIPLELLLACEDFRDFRAAPELGAENGWTGEPRPEQDRIYPDFRLYASTLNDVAALRDYFEGRNIETYTHAEEIEQINLLETGLNLIFTLICSTAAVGFFLSTASSVFAGIKRKERTLGLLQLMGFPTGSLMFFPLTQALLTAVFGSLLASGCYAGFSAVLNRLFAGALDSAGDVCRLNPEHFLLAAGISCGISLLAALGPALHSTRIEPSEVIRDV